MLVAGLRPVYAEVSPATVAIDPERLVLGPATRAVVLQNTFGIVDEPAARRLRDAARSVGALLVEDSAHCVGRLARDADGTPSRTSRSTRSASRSCCPRGSAGRCG